MTTAWDNRITGTPTATAVSSTDYRLEALRLAVMFNSQSESVLDSPRDVIRTAETFLHFLQGTTPPE